MDLSQLSQPALLHFYCCHRGRADGCPSPFAETFERIALSHSLVFGWPLVESGIMNDLSA